MAPRIARSSVSHSTKKQAGKKSRKRNLDAFAIAGKLAPETNKIRKHRFGEVEEERTRPKRSRDDSDGEDDGEPVEVDRSKRRRQDNDDDDVEYGSDSEGNEWKIGEVDEDDDESLDSDEAFGESDEERFEGFTFRGSSTTNASKKQKRGQSSAKDLDLNEEEEQSEEEDDFGEEGVDLATMLDDDNESDLDEADDADSESDEADEELSEGEGEDEDEKHARLQDFVEGLDPGATSGLHPAKTADTLTLEDLLEGADLDNKTLATLKPKKKAAAAALVKSNLPKRQQDTIDRKAAAAKAKEQLDRWQDSVIHNRRSDFLSFPLRDPDQAEPTSKDTFTPAQHSKPATDLEANIRQIMAESGMIAQEHGEDDIDDGLLKAEAMEANKLPVEEVLRRRAELRRMRILLDREEIKAKRIAKIKSKAYRRVHRRERERLEDKERMLLDPEAYANGELNQDEQEEADRRRAHARVNAKHKDSKWARSLRATDRATWDDDARAGVVEQARRQEELKRRIAGNDDVNESSDGESDDDDDDESTSEREALQRLQQPDRSEKKGLAALAFMQKAENRRKAENDAALASLQRELDSDAEEQSGIEDDGLGRAIFGPKREVAVASKPKVKRQVLEEGPASDEDDVVLVDTGDSSGPLEEPKGTVKAKAQARKASGLLAKASVKSTLDEPVATSSTSAWLTAPKGKKGKLDRKLNRDNDNETIINTNFDETDPLPADTPEAAIVAKDKKVNNTDGWTTVSYTQNDQEAGTQDQPILSKSERNAAFHARAFAGDDVAVQFAAEKDELIASEDEKESSSHMPGWGSWAGAGLSKAAKRAAERARHNPLYKTKTSGTRPQDRKDAKLENVIISEKSDRKGKKYLAPILPHQFERKEEYERSLRMPLGPEWTTKEVFQKNTRPRVVVRPGTIIEPMSRPLV